MVWLLILLPCAIVALGLLVLFAVQVSKKTFANCPQCNCHGGIRGFGNFCCTVCNQKFVLDGSGRLCSCLWKVLALPAIFSVVFAAIGIIWEIHSRSHDQHPYPGTTLAIISLLLGFFLDILMIVAPKRFPIDASD